MNQLNCHTELRLLNLADYLHLIVDRLESFEADVVQTEETVSFQFAFGTGRFEMAPGKLVMEASAAEVEGLRRVKELFSVAIELYAKSEKPEMAWEGDLADDTVLSSFRLMRVRNAWQLTPGMRRVRLEGENLDRFESFTGMHIRMLFPTETVPDPVWPIAGANGLALWPSEDRKPTTRVYTIRKLDVKAGYMDVDFVVHGDPHGGDEGIGSAWALNAAEGDVVGIMGPLGRPVRSADWYLMGCDETGLPAMSRILENLPADTRGVAFVEVDGAADEQQISCPPGLELKWIHRNGVPGGQHAELARAVCAVDWPQNVSSFGWFASEADAAKQVREYWRKTLGYGRDQTLAAGYWKRGAAGLMAG